MIGYVRYEFRKMISLPEFWVALIVCFLIPVIGIMLPTKHYAFPGYNQFGPTPELYSLLEANDIGDITYIIGPILASVPIACSYFHDKKRHMDQIVIPRGGRNKYFLCKVLLTLITGFIISVLPFVIHTVYCEIAYTRGPMEPYITKNFYDPNYEFDISASLYGVLKYNHPLLNTLLHIGMIGLWGAGLALLTHCISLFFRKYYVLNLCLGGLAGMLSMLVIGPIAGLYWVVQNYFTIGPAFVIPLRSAPFIVLGILYLIDAALICVHLFKSGDVL